MYHHYKSKGHKTFFIVNLRSKKRFLSFESATNYVYVRKSRFVCTIPQAAILMMMVMMMMMCKCVTVSVCLYRFTSAARFFKDTIHVPPLTFTLFGRQKKLYTLIAYLFLEKESILELSLLPDLTGEGPQNEDIYVQI